MFLKPLSVARLPFIKKREKVIKDNCVTRVSKKLLLKEAQQEKSKMEITKEQLKQLNEKGTVEVVEMNGAISLTTTLQVKDSSENILDDKEFLFMSVLSDAQHLIGTPHLEDRFRANGLINLAKSIALDKVTIKRDGIIYDYEPKGERFCKECLHCHDKGAKCLTAQEWGADNE